MSRELRAFVLVGAAATLTHIAVAILLERQLDLRPQMANFGGYISAVGLSYFGHARLTFRVTGNHAVHLPKFIVVSLVGLVTGSVLVTFLAGRHDVPFVHTMVLVGGTVASTTFILSKFWAFSQSYLTSND